MLIGSFDQLLVVRQKRDLPPLGIFSGLTLWADDEQTGQMNGMSATVWPKQTTSNSRTFLLVKLFSMAHIGGIGTWAHSLLIHSAHSPFPASISSPPSVHQPPDSAAYHNASLLKPSTFMATTHQPMELAGDHPVQSVFACYVNFSNCIKASKTVF